MRTAGSSPSTPPVLVVAEGWVLDALAESRLRAQLERAAPEVCGVAARPAPLPPGVSYRSMAARQTLEPWSRARPSPDGVAEGAVLLRAGVAHEADGHRLRVDPGAGSLLVDPGAHVHDPGPAVRAAPSELGPADDAAQAPFPWQPVVVLLGLAADPSRAEWARALADELLAHDVDARLALAVDPGGRQMSRPCRAERRSLAALAPDVVVTLDADAAAVVDDWLGTDRLAFVIPVDDGLDRGVELVSWRIGHDQGRVRARVGPSVTADELGATVARLCSGPQPLPPHDDPACASASDDLRREVGAVITAIRPPRRTPTPVDVTFVEAHGDPRWPALAAHLVRAGHRVAQVGDPSVGLGAKGVVILPARAAGPSDSAAVEARRAAGGVTVVVADADDLAGDQLSGATASLVRAAGRVLVPSRWLADRIDDPHVAVLVVPPLTAGAIATTAAVDEVAVGDGPRAIGWSVHDGDPDERAAVVEAVGDALEARPDLALVLDGPAAGEVSFPPAVGARVRRGPLAGSTAAAHLVLLWTADTEAVARTGTAGPLVDAGLTGRPTLVSSTNPAADLVGLPPDLRVATPADRDAWAAALHPMLDDDAWRAAHSAAVTARTEALLGDASATLTVDRLLGWLKGRDRG